MLLRASDKKILNDLFAECLKNPVEVWIYGSRVNGTAHEASDIDLVVRTKDLKPVDTEQFMLLQEKITESNIPVLVEVRDWAALPESFHKEIEKRHEVLYSTLKH